MALERHQPVALLPDRPADTGAQGLREPPEGAVIAQDRATADAAGARPGAPAATQVADRLHVLQNLKDVLAHVFTMHEQTLDTGNATLRPPPVPLSAGALAVSVPPPDIPLPVPQRAAARHARRQALPTQVWALHRQGRT